MPDHAPPSGETTASHGENCVSLPESPLRCSVRPVIESALARRKWLTDLFNEIQHELSSSFDESPLGASALPRTYEEEDHHSISSDSSPDGQSSPELVRGKSVLDNSFL